MIRHNKRRQWNRSSRRCFHLYYDGVGSKLWPSGCNCLHKIVGQIKLDPKKNTLSPKAPLKCCSSACWWLRHCNCLTRVTGPQEESSSQAQLWNKHITSVTQQQASSTSLTLHITGFHWKCIVARCRCERSITDMSDMHHQWIIFSGMCSLLILLEKSPSVESRRGTPIPSSGSSCER